MTDADTTTNLYDVLAERGLVAQCTETDDAIRKRLASPVSAYIGFDPTADSLHVGSLVPMMGLAWLQRLGHKPIVLVGGATAMIGDPSGKSDARKMLTTDDITHNAEGIKRQLSGFLRFDDSPTGAVMVNNADWLGGLTWVEVLRDFGPHFSVNRMLTMDSVKSRLDAAREGDASGLSFLEFNYMVMQAMDFVHLHREQGCVLQMGGQDQWGNIVMGIELGRRLADAELAGLTLPLVTKSDGGKFGKSESGNVWLSPDRTSPYEFFQFWRNAADGDVGKYLRLFTFLPMDEVRELERAQGAAINDAKARLAYEVTQLVHGEDEAGKAKEAAVKAFGQGDVTAESVPSMPLDSRELAEGLGLLALIVKAGFAKSNGEARRLVQGGGVRLHDKKIGDVQRTVTSDDVADGYVLLRVGKKKLMRFDVEG